MTTAVIHQAHKFKLQGYVEKLATLRNTIGRDRKGIITRVLVTSLSGWFREKSVSFITLISVSDLWWIHRSDENESMRVITTSEY